MRHLLSRASSVLRMLSLDFASKMFMTEALKEAPTRMRMHESQQSIYQALLASLCAGPVVGGGLVCF